jgi:hypothetical protein
LSKKKSTSTSTTLTTTHKFKKSNKNIKNSKTMNKRGMNDLRCIEVKLEWLNLLN